MHHSKVLILTFSLFISPLAAQHCAFNGAHILVVKVMDSEYNEHIPNLKLYFLDTEDQVVMKSFYREGSWQEDTLFMWTNPDSTTHSGIIDNNHPMNPWQINFWFAEHDYVYVGGKMPGAKLVVEDRDGLQNGGKYPTTIIKLEEGFLYPLYTGINKWKWGPNGGFLENYQPFEVWL